MLVILGVPSHIWKKYLLTDFFFLKIGDHTITSWVFDKISSSYTEKICLILMKNAHFLPWKHVILHHCNGKVKIVLLSDENHEIVMTKKIIPLYWEKVYTTEITCLVNMKNAHFSTWQHGILHHCDLKNENGLTLWWKSWNCHWIKKNKSFVLKKALSDWENLPDPYEKYRFLAMATCICTIGGNIA